MCGSSRRFVNLCKAVGEASETSNPGWTATSDLVEISCRVVIAFCLPARHRARAPRAPPRGRSRDRPVGRGVFLPAAASSAAVAPSRAVGPLAGTPVAFVAARLGRPPPRCRAPRRRRRLLGRAALGLPLLHRPRRDVHGRVRGGPGRGPGDPPTHRTLKLLSEDPANYESAPREGIRRILQDVTGEVIPRDAPVPTKRIEWIRMGTTVATNALLERTGARTALLVTEGFADLLAIGNQARPDIFDLKIEKPGRLYEEVVEVRERVRVVDDDASAGRADETVVEGVTGERVLVETPLDVESLRPKLQSLLDAGVRSLAVVLMHSYAFPAHENAVGHLARSMGFDRVSLSSALVPMAKIVPRGHTASVDAYLTPCIREYLRVFLSGFDEGLADVKVSFMQSDGGLTPAAKFTGYKAVLSGPAGGVVGYAMTASKDGAGACIGFDMGGTSTDVSRFDGACEQVTETETAG